MKYEQIEKARFLERPNRFIAYVETERGREVCHVKNTGRCRELLVPGATIYVQRNENPNRKTPLDLITVEKGDRLINMDSQIPNRVVEEWLRAGNLVEAGSFIKPESKYGNSRFDFYMEEVKRKIFMEVKGVTLEEDGVAAFPDAPTLRGIKHIEELCQCRAEGYDAYIFFVIQMDRITYFHPNDRTQPEFGMALKKAKDCGVHLLAYDCQVDTDSIIMGKPVEIRL